MAIDDIVFSEGEKNNFVVEVPNSVANSPVDILSENSNTGGLSCLETPLIVNTATTPPAVILLSDGKLAKRISDSFYLKL